MTVAAILQPTDRRAPSQQPDPTSVGPAARADRFDYRNAFSRNIGWVTEFEQEILRDKCVAIAGLGGVGGAHLMTLTRLGVGRFRIADLDRFEEANFNRQVGASQHSCGRPKVEVMAELARGVNPELEIESFPHGVTSDNLEQFLAGADLYLDGLDFFAMAIRREVFAACARLGVPAVTVAPLGMGAALLNFLPGAMSFEDYFGLEGLSEHEQLLRFLVGLAPAALHARALVDPTTVDLAAHRGPSTPMACEICAGIAGSEALKILLRRGSVRPAPWGLQFDAYRNRMTRTFRPWGHRHPLQRLTIAVARRQFLKRHGEQLSPEPSERGDTSSDQDAGPESGVVAVEPAPTVAEQVLELGRWAPSGDNNQPWRFELRGADELRVLARDQADWDVYDYNDGQPSWLSFGCLLETIRLAATRFGRHATWTFEGSRGREHRFHVALEPRAGLVEDPLARHIVSRSVDRRPFRTTPLSASAKEALERAAGEQFRLDWREAPRQRLDCALVNALATDIRLRIPEAFRVHQHMIDWDNRHSPSGIPAGAVGLDPLTLKLMRWALEDFRRLHFVNRLSGTAVPQVALDLLPGLGCAAHFLMTPTIPGTPLDKQTWLAAGVAMQRIWLTAEQLGLALQPSFAPLVFAFSGRHDVPFTEAAAERAKAQTMARAFDRLTGSTAAEEVLLFARIGSPKPRRSATRSVRRPLSELAVSAGGAR
ncbi:MAG: ThiF family adenylyltransferase [Deltaproteobacteria bacterium]|jgi:molybdopterin/thiamine biosynthesis adenylyltransferase|nr:ThiF family adenylyltransferase [Deltaproteobacteria bacterium]MBW2534978.1 ThiF family adenylyltransferase [Deltaproteobacteria bacterium]